MRNFSPFLIGVTFTFAAGCFAQAIVPLGTAGNFGVLAATAVTNTGGSVVSGDLGVSPGSAITGFPPGVVIFPGTIQAGDPTAATAHNDLSVAYMNASSQASTQNLSGQDLGGKTLGPGVYTFSNSAQLTGTLTLSGTGFYIFQIGSTLTTAGASIVAAINGADAATIFWQVGSSATLGAGSTFIGNILAEISITATTGVIMAGRLLALTGAVTLDTTTVTYPPATIPGGLGGPPLPSATPAPSSWILVAIGLGCAMLYQTRKRRLRPRASC